MTSRQCPCGLTQEMVIMGKLHDDRGICKALGDNGEPCGFRIAEHPSHPLSSQYGSSHLHFDIPSNRGHPKEDTCQYHLEKVDGTLDTLSEFEGFRGYVAGKMKEIGVKGYIKRVPRDHATLLVSGTSDQIQLVEDFLSELEDERIIHGHFRERPERIPISKTFKILSSDRKFVLTGSYSNHALDEMNGKHLSSDDPIVLEP
mmetsp:Transcript_20998/g.15404  ORF Transcript_20998/g.15404 Transcript_20998/m.15404 type:complete len:202 (-) Transcript_20998:45-650(-)|eukprot:CAMPEP_0202960702 /NCGR_PEP_ID=MMETSP1396-20130829/4857_1 /ASSEMBLY_ACC=CAM_ASM_000872 /TAXON_ID= /ORGANISM="Pseudokeronopsis sp., Strain Brazil" /LENGTH=201 /DNA_ID=CAMNT_0049680095 /DNA_START=93 /DNA_END=698 /DNA_ORIENTATION=+